MLYTESAVPPTMGTGFCQGSDCSSPGVPKQTPRLRDCCCEGRLPSKAAS